MMGVVPVRGMNMSEIVSHRSLSDLLYENEDGFSGMGAGNNFSGLGLVENNLSAPEGAGAGSTKSVGRAIFECLATCHSLTRFEQRLLGDPLGLSSSASCPAPPPEPDLLTH